MGPGAGFAGRLVGTVEINHDAFLGSGAQAGFVKCEPFMALTFHEIDFYTGDSSLAATAEEFGAFLGSFETDPLLFGVGTPAAPDPEPHALGGGVIGKFLECCPSAIRIARLEPLLAFVLPALVHEIVFAFELCRFVDKLLLFGPMGARIVESPPLPERASGLDPFGRGAIWKEFRVGRRGYRFHNGAGVEELIEVLAEQDDAPRRIDIAVHVPALGVITEFTNQAVAASGAECHAGVVHDMGFGEGSEPCAGQFKGHRHAGIIAQLKCLDRRFHMQAFIGDGVRIGINGRRGRQHEIGALSGDMATAAAGDTHAPGNALIEEPDFEGPSRAARDIHRKFGCGSRQRNGFLEMARGKSLDEGTQARGRYGGVCASVVFPQQNPCA